MIYYDQIKDRKPWCEFCLVRELACYCKLEKGLSSHDPCSYAIEFICPIAQAELYHRKEVSNDKNS